MLKIENNLPTLSYETKPIFLILDVSTLSSCTRVLCVLPLVFSVQDYFSRNYSDVLWIGLRQMTGSINGLVWVDGTTFGYLDLLNYPHQPWDTSVPNIISPGVFSCITLSANHKWSDEDCGNPHHAVCEKGKS